MIELNALKVMVNWFKKHQFIMKNINQVITLVIKDKLLDLDVSILDKLYECDE